MRENNLRCTKSSQWPALNNLPSFQASQPFHFLDHLCLFHSAVFIFFFLKRSVRDCNTVMQRVWGALCFAFVFPWFHFVRWVDLKQCDPTNHSLRSLGLDVRPREMRYRSSTQRFFVRSYMKPKAAFLLPGSNDTVWETPTASWFLDVLKQVCTRESKIRYQRKHCQR